MRDSVSDYEKRQFLKQGENFLESCPFTIS